MIEAIDAEEFQFDDDYDDEHIVEDDFMAYVGVDLDEKGTVQNGLSSYVFIGLSVIAMGITSIGACIHRKNGGNKYQIIE